MSQRKAPIIIVGMHRSGTSMVSRILKSLGVFMGKNTGVHDEAAFFLRLNTWILNQAGASWDAPDNIDFLNQNEGATNQIVRYLKYVIRTPLIISYMGFFRFLRYFSLPLPTYWGWKDPVTCLTLPIWLKLYPEAKVIFVKRHGMDVANSLKVRGDAYAKKSSMRFEKYFAYRIYTMLFRHILPGRRVRAFNDSLACINLEQGLRVWKKYNDVASEGIHQVKPQNLLKIKYEDLLEKPEFYTQKIVDFCDIEIKEKELLSLLSEKLDASKAYSYQKKENLVAVANEHKALLATHGY